MNELNVFITGLLFSCAVGASFYSYALGFVIQTGFMTLAGWLIWRWIKATKNEQGLYPKGAQ